MNSLDKLKKAFVEAVLEKLLIEGATGLAKQFNINNPEEFNMLVSLDPTYDSSNDNGYFIKWIFGLYNKFKANEKAKKKYQDALEYMKTHKDAAVPPKPELSQDKLEDFDKIKDHLNTLKDRVNLNTFDMDQFKSVADLAAYVRDIKEKDISVDEKAEDKYKVFRAAEDVGLVVIYKGPNFIIGVPETYKASSHFKNPVTDWCTANPNMYKNYLDEYGGKYYIHLNKKTGDLYQLHYESNQFKDASDKEINKVEFINKYPELKDFYNKLIDGIQIKDKDFQIVINNKIMEYDPTWWCLFDKHVPSDKKDFVNDLKNLNNASEEVQLAAVMKFGEAIEFINNPSEKVQLAAVEKTPGVIQYIENPSEAVQIAAVMKNGGAIQYIENPSEAVQMTAVQNNGFVIKYIKDPSEEVQLAAVKKYGFLLGNIIKAGIRPSEEVQLAAVKDYGEAIEFINNPSEKVQLAAVENYPEAIKYIENPSEAVQMTAVKNFGFVIQYIKDPSEEVQLAAVENNPGVIKYIENPSEAVQMTAVKKYGFLLEIIIKAGIRPSEEVQMAAVQKNGRAIRHIKDPSEEVQLAAVENDPGVIRCIKNPYQSVIKYVNEHK